MATTISSWADLPSELLVKVSKCLKTRIQNSRFRSVCTNWRSSVPSIQNPIKFPIDFPLDFGDDHGVFRLTEKTIYCVEPVTESSSSVKYWLICVEEAEGGKVHLINLFTGVRIQKLPPTFPTMFDLYNFRLTELQKLYRLELDVKPEGTDSIQDISTKDFRKLMFSTKFFLSCMSKLNPQDKIIVRKVVLLSNLSNEDEIVLVLLKSNGMLSFFKFGTTKEWILLKDMDDIGSFKDIANYKGKLCAINGEGKTIIIDTSFNVTEIESHEYVHCNCRYLVESSGDLFLAEQKMSHSNFYDESIFGDLNVPEEEDFSFKVYKLYEEEFRWIEVTNIGDCVFFTSNRYSAYWSFCLMGIQVPLSLKNCIIFKDRANDVFGTNENDYELGTLMVFHLDTGKMGDISPEDGEMFWGS